MSFFNLAADLGLFDASANSPSMGTMDAALSAPSFDFAMVPPPPTTPLASASPTLAPASLPETFQWDLLMQQQGTQHDEDVEDIERVLARALPSEHGAAVADVPLVLKKPLVVPADLQQAVAKATAEVVAEQQAAAPQKLARASKAEVGHESVAPAKRARASKPRASNPRKRRKKTSGDEAYLTPRQKHLKIEKRRRENINTSLTRLREMVPACEDGDYKSVVLEKTVDHMEELRAVVQRAADAMTAMLGGNTADAADVIAALREAANPTKAE